MPAATGLRSFLDVAKPILKTWVHSARFVRFCSFANSKSIQNPSKCLVEANCFPRCMREMDSFRQLIRMYISENNFVHNELCMLYIQSIEHTLWDLSRQSSAHIFPAPVKILFWETSSYLTACRMGATQYFSEDSDWSHNWLLCMRLRQVAANACSLASTCGTYFRLLLSFSLHHW